jgi:hypothetical protein
MAKEVYLNLYSPRWGHDDRYTFKFDENEIYASMGGPKEAICIRNEKGTLIWSGHNQNIGNPLLNILSDDSIFPPTIFIKAIIYAWDSWRDGELSDDQLKSELELLTNWVNVVSRSKPNSDYWISQF